MNHNHNPYTNLLHAIKDLEEDFVKFFEKGNGAAGTRIRKGLQDLKKICHEMRQDIQHIKNSKVEQQQELLEKTK